MARMRAVIVDDVPLARERVARYIAEESDVDIVGEAATGADAVRLIASEQPDIAFLDVGLPDFDGFEIVRRLAPELAPVVIFLTAHGEKALEGFEVRASDYLMKPFGRERFARCMDRAREQLRLKRGLAPAASSRLTRLAIREKDRIDVIEMSDIDYIDVGGHYLCIHVGTTVHLMRGQLGEMEERLDPSEFARVHRSAIVRLDRVKAFAPRRNGDCDLILKDGAKVLMSRTYRASVFGRLGLQDA